MMIDEVHDRAPLYRLWSPSSAGTLSDLMSRIMKSCYVLYLSTQTVLLHYEFRSSVRQIRGYTRVIERHQLNGANRLMSSPYQVTDLWMTGVMVACGHQSMLPKRYTNDPCKSQPCRGAAERVFFY